MFIMTAGSAALSASCGFIVEINRDNKEVLKYFSFSDNVYEAINQCAFSDSEGDLNQAFNPYPEGSSKIATDGMITNMYTLFEGFATYTKWRASATTATTVPAIDDFSETLEQYRTGGLYDYSDVETVLEQFNSLNSCSGNTYYLQNGQCSSSSNCIEIIDSASYSTPSCVTDVATAKQLYNILYNYQSGENSYITSMQD